MERGIIGAGIITEGEDCVLQGNTMDIQEHENNSKIAPKIGHTCIRVPYIIIGLVFYHAAEDYMGRSHASFQIPFGLEVFDIFRMSLRRKMQQNNNATMPWSEFDPFHQSLSIRESVVIKE